MKDHEALTISVFSFGFHVSGIPRDPGGHGGGFVFDCRGLPNPGRDPEFQKRTGEDPEVRDFLEKSPQVERFIENAWTLIRDSALNYQQRGFGHLMVSFGCTGGQHRSVYCADLMAARLRREGFQVRLTHMDKPDFS